MKCIVNGKFAIAFFSVFLGLCTTGSAQVTGTITLTSPANGASYAYGAYITASGTHQFTSATQAVLTSGTIMTFERPDGTRN